MKAIFKTRDLTTGNEGKAMVLFALPFMMGNLFQQLYNIVDTIVVGQYIGADALAGAADMLHKSRKNMPNGAIS